MWWRPLNPVEVEAYDVLPARLARRVRVARVPLLPGGYAGITLGRLVLVVPPVASDGTSALLAHELVHVRQWHELGAVGFAVRYLAQFARGLVRHRRWRPAYRGNSFEAQARDEAGRWWLRQMGRSGPGADEPLP